MTDGATSAARSVRSPIRLRALSLCTCCRHYPGAAAGRSPRSSHPTVSAFPGRVTGSACTSTFSRLARRSLTLRPAHLRGHQVVTAIRRLQPFRYLHDCSDCFRLERIAGWALHPLESAALSRRTPEAAIRGAHKRGPVRWWEVYRITVVAAVAPIGSSRNLEIASRQKRGTLPSHSQRISFYARGLEQGPGVGTRPPRRWRISV